MTPQFICLNSWESPDNFSFRWVENVWWQKIKPLFLSWYNKTILITTPKGNNTFCFPFFSWRLPLCAYWLQCRKQTTSQGLSNDRILGRHYQWHRNLVLCRGEMGTTIGDKIVETLYLNRVTSESKRIRTPPLSPLFKVGVFVVFYR